MNILTFDIEEWFHIDFRRRPQIEKHWEQFESRIHLNMDRIFRFLDNTDYKATFFCVGWLARKYPDVIKRIDSYGHEIGSHSDLHLLDTSLSFDEYKTSFKRAIDSLEDITGKKVRAYRAPAFSITSQNKWAFEIMIENGIEFDSSIFPARKRNGGFHEIQSTKPFLLECEGGYIKEFPLNPYSLLGKKVVFSGGGYFRFFPYQAIQKMAKDTSYMMSYFHPRDFDPDQPIIRDLPLQQKFRSYYGLKSCGKKFEQFLKDFDFIDLDEADKLTDWDAVEKYVISSNSINLYK